MSETVETLAKRLDRLEVTVQQMSDKLSRLTEESTAQQKPPEKPKTDVEIIKEMAIDKRPLSQAIRKIIERTGIDEELIPIEELQQRMARHGIRPEDNEFSRAIIAEREK